MKQLKLDRYKLIALIVSITLSFAAWYHVKKEMVEAKNTSDKNHDSIVCE